MKKLFLAVALVAVCSTAFAQNDWIPARVKDLPIQGVLGAQVVIPMQPPPPEVKQEVVMVPNVQTVLVPVPVVGVFGRHLYFTYQPQLITVWNPQIVIRQVQP